MVYKGSNEEIRARGIEAPSFTQTLKERAVLQTAAAVIDAAVGYGAYQGIKAIDGSSDNSGDDESTHNTKTTTANNNSSGENTTIVQGDGNTVTINTGDTLPPESSPDGGESNE